LELIIVSMFIGWLTCIPAVLLPHSPCRSTTANAPANRQMPIASVVMAHIRKKKMRHLQTTILVLFILTSCHSYRLVTVGINTKTNYFRSISTVPDSNLTKRKFKSSIGGKDTFKLELDSANDFMNKWVYFDLDKPTKLKVILPLLARICNPAGADL